MRADALLPRHRNGIRSVGAVYGASLVSAGAWAAALGYGVSLLGWVAFLPLWIVWDRVPVAPQSVLTHTAGPALLVHIGAYVAAYPWILHHATAAGVQAGASALLLLSLLYSLPLMAGGALVLQNRAGAGIAVWVGAWMLVDLVVQRGPWAFPWVLGAHAVVDSPGAYTLVRLGGTVALTAGIGALHAGAFWLYRAFPLTVASMRRTVRLWGRPLRGALLLMLLLGGLLALYGLTMPASTSMPTAPATVWAVQPNVPPTTWAQADADTRRDRLQTLTETALDTAATAPDLIVWPETALHPPDTTGMQALTTRWRTTLLTGAVLSGTASGAVTNAVLLYTPNAPVRRYDKHHLVPFAEAVPGASWWRALNRFAMEGDRDRVYMPGPGATAWTQAPVPVVPLVCFESLASPFLAALGSDLTRTRGLITIAQTGWWQRAQPARQHVQYSRLRAMETGRPLLVASVSGPTTLVAPSGAATPLASYDTEAVVSVQWPAPHPPGWYVRTAPYTDIAWTAIALLLVRVPARLSS